MRSVLMLTAIFIAGGRLCAANPVLEYSLKFGGSRTHTVNGVALGADGSTYVAGWTDSSDFPVTHPSPFGISEQLPGLFVSRLSVDGTSVMCSVSIGGVAKHGVQAMALRPDGSVYVFGRTAIRNFPITGGSTGLDSPLFLIRINPCEGRLLSSTVFLPNATPYALAVDRAGNAIVTARWNGPARPDGFSVIDPDGYGILLKIDPNGRQLAAARAPNEPHALAIGSDDSVYIAGPDASLGYAMFVAKLDPEIQSASYIRRIRNGVATAIAADDTGHLYVTGSGDGGFSLTSDAAFSGSTSPGGRNGILLKLNPQGDIVYASYTDRLVDRSDQRQGIGVALDRSGKVYVAIQGGYHLPEVGSGTDSSPLWGLRVRVFTPDGFPEEGDLFVPADLSFGVSAGFGREGRLAVATTRSAAPPTPGSLAATVTEPVSVVKVDFAISDKPELDLDLEAVRFLLIYLGADYVEGKTKVVHVTADGLAVPFSIALVPESGLLTSHFSISERAATTPAEIPITIDDASPRGTVAIFAAAGLRGGFRVLPLRSEEVRANFRTSVDGLLDLPAPSTQPLRLRMRLWGEARTRYGPIEVAAPYRVETSVPWLKVENSAGIAPADLELIADPTGLSPGVYRAPLTLGDRNNPTIITFTVGPVFQLVGQPTGTVNVPVGSPPLTFPMRLTSSGVPLEFRISPQFGWIDVSPKTGLTPADLVLTLDPAKFQQSDLPPSGSWSFTIESSSAGVYRYFITPNFVRLAPAPDFPLDVNRPAISPGALVDVSDFAPPCESATARLPWPFQLGGCSVRFNGTGGPIGATTASTTGGAVARSIRLSAW